MSDLSPTAADVIADASAVTEHGYFGSTAVPGDMLYKDSSDGLWKLADNDSATSAAKTPQAMALNGGVSGQPVKVAKSGPVSMGAILTAGASYYLSSTAGKICPLADIGTGETATFIGIAHADEEFEFT